MEPGFSEAIDKSELESAIIRGVEFLSRSQLPSGEFRVLMSRDNSLETGCVSDSSPFATALITYSLGFAQPGHPPAQAMIERALDFFVTEMEGRGLWRYWTKQHQYHSTIPPDLDDIACISYVLRKHGIAFPDNRGIILANRNSRGLFHTWITPRWPLTFNAHHWAASFRQWLNPIKSYYFWKLNESGRNDLDCIVNANVLLYLDYIGAGEAAAPVVDYLLDALQRGNEDCCDKWHLNRFTFYYAVARNLRAGISGLAPARDEIVARIVKASKPDGSIGDNELDTALAACALRCCQSSAPELDKAIEFLLTRQRVEGDWPRAVLYYGGPKKYYGWGSEELTTGFCLEALLHYRQTSS